MGLFSIFWWSAAWPKLALAALIAYSLDCVWSLVPSGVSAEGIAFGGPQPRSTAREDPRMLDITEDIALATANWLEQFESALRTCDGKTLKALLHHDSYWRDVLALS